MIDNKPYNSDMFELVLFKRDAAGEVKEDEKESFSSNDASKISDFYERRAGYLERRKQLAKRRKYEELEKNLKLKRKNKNAPHIIRKHKSEEDLPTKNEHIDGRQLYRTIRKEKHAFLEENDSED